MRDVHLQLTDEAFARAEREAQAVGASVEQFLADYVQDSLADDSNVDSFFTPEVLAELDEAVAEAAADPTRYTPDEVDRHFAEKSAAWKKTRAS
jgi:hypothetical protein